MLSLFLKLRRSDHAMVVFNDRVDALELETDKAKAELAFSNPSTYNEKYTNWLHLLLKLSELKTLRHDMFNS
jgi:hypothetical protein